MIAQKKDVASKSSKSAVKKKKRNILTSRDIKMINFLEETKLLITPRLAGRMFYTSKRSKENYSEYVANPKLRSQQVVAGRRCTVMFNSKQLKRYRAHIDQQYVYYYKDIPKNPDHKLMIMEFIVNCSEDFQVIHVETEFQGLVQNYRTRPDAVITVLAGDMYFDIVVECDNTKPFTKKDEYKRIYNDKSEGKLDEIFPRPTLFVTCCKKNPNVEEMIWVSSDFSNFSNIRYELI